MRTCETCDESKAKDPKCGLCCGPTAADTRWHRTLISDYDGVFVLPEQVRVALIADGFTSEEGCLDA